MQNFLKKLKITVALSKGTDVTYNYYYRVQDSGTDYARAPYKHCG